MRPTAFTVQRVVSAHFDIPTATLLSRERTHKTALARHVAVWICRRDGGLSLAQTGRRFGDLDHTSILYAQRRIERMMAEDVAFLGVIADLRARCAHGLEAAAA